MSNSHKFIVGTIDNGCWLAVSKSAPYFCFEGPTQDDVEAQAQRALSYYFGVAGKIVQRPRGRDKALSTFAHRKTVEREGVDA